MSAMLYSLVAKLMTVDAHEKRAPELRQLLFNATRQAFAADGAHQPVATDCPHQRIVIVQLLIDRHLTDERLTAQWLADRVGVSLRTLQQDFNQIGTTLTSLIRARRLHYAREQLASACSGSGLTIAEVAYNSGFNDISYFNRCFKKAFDCVPKDILSQEGNSLRFYPTRAASQSKTSAHACPP
jgi:AraC-like DNA-binding protein